MFPDFYSPDKVGQLYEPDYEAAYAAGSVLFQHTAASDRTRVLLWLIDLQVDFVFPAPIGRLPVPGAVDDLRRTIEWLYRNVQQVTHISASLDTHTPFQIFYAPWWRDANGHPPAPYTVISGADVRAGRWQARFEPDWSVSYVESLESVGKKQLMIWSFHCMEGTNGRALAPALSEAILYHSAARQAPPSYISKGKIPHTEYYSVVEPEVKDLQHPEGDLNRAFLEQITPYDLIYVAGQARSHCVLETVRSVVRYFAGRPEVIRKFRFLDDCTSSITGFEKTTEPQLQEFAARGIRFVKAVDPIG
jgi:nicotinamidase-related amidase